MARCSSVHPSSCLITSHKVQQWLAIIPSHHILQNKECPATILPITYHKATDARPPSCIITYHKVQQCQATIVAYTVTYHKEQQCLATILSQSRSQGTAVPSHHPVSWISDIGEKFIPICDIMLCALQSDIGRSDIRLSPISLITDIGLSAHLWCLDETSTLETS